MTEVDIVWVTAPAIAAAPIENEINASELSKAKAVRLRGFLSKRQSCSFLIFYICFFKMKALF